jgi:hypothetical protein
VNVGSVDFKHVNKHLPNRSSKRTEGRADRLERAVQALAPKHKGGELEEFAAAQEALLEAERALAAAQNEPHAVPIEFPVQWDTGAPLPYLLQNDYRTFLVFFLRDVDPEWDGTYVNIRHAYNPSPSNLAVVEFKRCICTKIGTPNDEVFHGHPLNGVQVPT